MRVATFRAACLLVPLLSLAPASGFADGSTDECVAANAAAQRLRLADKFAAAREQLSACSESRCPAIVRDDCALRLDELERLQPTIVFDVKDALGSDISAVHVTVDDRLLTERLDGSSLRVDPGEHTFTFEAKDKPIVARRLVIHEGEKARRERIVVAAAGGSAPSNLAAPAESPVTQGTEQDHGGIQKPIGLTLGGLGVAAAVVGTVFGFLTISNWNSSKSECNVTACPQPDRAVSDHDAAVTDGTISTTAFIAAAVLVGTGMTLWLTAPSRTGTRAQSPLLQAHAPPVSPALRLGLGRIAIETEF